MTTIRIVGMKKSEAQASLFTFRAGCG